MRVTGFGLFVAAFLFLLGAAAAVGLAQFYSGTVAPMLSMGYSAGAVVCAVAAMLMRRPKR